MAHRNDPTRLVDFGRVYDSFMNDDDFLDAAYDEFCSLVDLDDAMIDDDEDREDFESLFFQWVLFDYDIFGGKTPLERFITWPPAGCGSNILSQYAQAATTQFTSVFRVVGRDKATHKLALENMLDGLVYRVLCPDLCDVLPETRGSITARIFRVNGTWQFAGSIIDYTTAEPGPQDLEAMRSTTGEHGDEFSVLVSVRFGHKPDDGAMGLRFASMRPEERAEALRDAQKAFEEAREQYGIPTTWDDVVRSISESEIAQDKSSLEALLSTFDNGPLGKLGPEQIMTFMRSFIVAWNLLPHKALGGKSIAEVFEESHPDEVADERAYQAEYAASQGEGAAGGLGNDPSSHLRLV